ncbi:hypothetical protein HO173_003334 [Letharia columbiana]|uniref:Uncharacterized protein n=1 Tax=Letharia columbiana TaxID=112416 RepID=A0A8H6L7P9_9LECA|nr:uncharacterized protein HO173_003334 [Letharia columbiana]KAF6238827.1 hypothetical protein HO173_003334 [Letharia columbiana]
MKLQIEQKPVLGLKRAADMGLHPQQKIMKMSKDSQAEQKRSLFQTMDLTEFDWRRGLQ